MRRKRILVVDDEEKTKESIGIMFNRDYDVVFAEKGNRVFEFFEKPETIDLLLLDISLPDIEGIEVLRRVREEGSKIPVIIITADDSKKLLKQIIPLNINGYFDKPFNVHELVKQVNKLLLLKQESLNKNITRQHSIKEKIELAKEFINENHNLFLSLREITEKIYVEPKYFSRRFKEIEGIGFYEYRTKKKLERAKELLRMTDYTITEICNEVGYSQLSCLTKVFKKFMGIDPRGYRKRYKELNLQGK